MEFKRILFRIVNKIHIRLASSKEAMMEKVYWRRQSRILKTKILNYYEILPRERITFEEKEVVDYLQKNKLIQLPYEFVKNYKRKGVVVQYDKERRLRYVGFENKKLFYRKDWGVKKIQNYHANLLAEQDINSPHRYLTHDFNVNPGSVVIDAGSAEGIFALMVIEKAKKIFVFEPDPLWVEALEATFEPWKGKVTIIEKFISSSINQNSISLDDQFADVQVDFIKIDVEGWERAVFTGAEKLLKLKHPLKIVVATYHHHNDELELMNLLTKKGFMGLYSHGYITYYYQPEFELPYLRRCLIRAEKSF